MTQFVIQGEEEMLTLAAKLGAAVSEPSVQAKQRQNPHGLIIVLQGLLGAGKTTFVRGFLRYLGVSGKVKSPTYALIEPYHTELGQVFHVDLYRINDESELPYLGLDDYFKPQHICLIEWPERGKAYLPVPSLKIAIIFEGDHKRHVAIEAQEALGEEILVCLST